MTLDADRAGTIGCVDALLVLAWQGCASFARHAHTHSGLLHAAALDQRALSWHARKGRIYKNTKPALVNLNMIMQGGTVPHLLNEGNGDGGGAAPVAGELVLPPLLHGPLVASSVRLGVVAASGHLPPLVVRWDSDGDGRRRTGPGVNR